MNELQETIKVSIPYSTIKIGNKTGFLDGDYVSIPYSTIKINQGRRDRVAPWQFQFLIVRLKYTARRTSASGRYSFNSL